MMAARMRRRWARLAAAVLPAAGGRMADGRTPSAGQLSVVPYVFQTDAGELIDAELGRVMVPER